HNRTLIDPNSATATRQTPNNANSSSATEYTCHPVGSRGTPCRTPESSAAASVAADTWWLQAKNSDVNSATPPARTTQSASASGPRSLAARASSLHIAFGLLRRLGVQEHRSGCGA